MSQPDAHDLEDIQGIVYSGWNHHRYAGFLFARLGDDAARSRRWLAGMLRAVTPAARHRRPAHGRLQLALTPSGLSALGVPADVLEAMPPEVTHGMASRARVLEDPDPSSWQLGAPRDRLDVLVMVYATTERARHGDLATHRAALAATGATVYADELGWPMGLQEHFGFADGLSQPYVPGMHTGPRPGEDRIAAGEILLGYPNAYDQLPRSPIWNDFDLGRNGSYLVFRKLAQDVAGFWGWIDRHARSLARGNAAAAAELSELIAAKLVGRWRSGAPLVLAPDQDDPAHAAPDRVNAFRYLAEDPDGLRCPISSHIRRANPRDARGGSPEDSETVVSRHRIVRRGRSYGAPLALEQARAGSDDGVARGLYFVCLQSSIARGFEFIQQTWLANRGFGGLHQEVDPLVGNSAGKYSVSIPAEPFRLRLANLPSVVTTVGGGYFFLPSRSAIARIASGP